MSASVRITLALSIGLIATSLPSDLARGAEAAPDFLRDVRPVLSAYCFKCHGPDEGARKGGLRLDLRDSALQGGKSGDAAITPNQPNKSAIVARIFSTNDDEVMPPSSVKHPLEPAQKEILRRWIAAGAEYRPHWAFLAPRKVTPPTTRLGGFPIRNPIDSFIAARLRAEKLKASPEADRQTLARRVSFDLTGLPPTPEQADAFARDTRPDAYEQMVDRLLASPQYGERWARKWLDLARYADSNGYEKDRSRNIWPYRDWVIRAINADMPFDQFTIEQLAGDLLPQATTEDRVATGFHRNTMLNEEGGIDPLEFRYYAVVDRVNTTSTTWLGLTVGCAQCHTHKYDPILHTDYYQLMAFLNNADEPDLDLPPPDAAERQAEREKRAAQLLASLPARWPVDTGPIRWSRVQPAIDSSSPTNDPARLLVDDSLLFASPGPERSDLVVRFKTTLTNVTHLRVSALADDSLPSRGPGRTPHGNFVLSELTLTETGSTNGKPTTIALGNASATAEQKGFPANAAIDGKPETGWAVQQEGRTLNTNHAAVFILTHALQPDPQGILRLRLQQNHGSSHTIGRLAIDLGVASSDERPESLRRQEALELAFDHWLERERQRTVNWRALPPSVWKSNLPLLSPQPDASILVSGDITKNDTYELTFTSIPTNITAIRLEALPDDSLPAHGPGMTYYEGPRGDFFLGEFQVTADGQPVRLASASESFARNNFGGTASARAAIDGDLQTGWTCADRPGEPHQAVFTPATPIRAQRLTVKMQFGRHYACSLGHFRISATSDPRGAEARDLPDATERLLAIPAERVTTNQLAQLRQQFLLGAPELAAASREIRDLRRAPNYQTTLALRERPPGARRPTFVHKRGEFLQPTERVEPGVPQFLPPLPDGVERDRLALARWLVSPTNPLTARVVVNRYWASFFGRGLVGTLNDFGFQGDLPTHPELLDWLAIEFRDHGWSVKQLHRLIVTSSTYRQSSRLTPELLARDPQNRLLARGPRVRLDAEQIRDGALAAAGVLSAKMFGPPVHPPQPAGVTEVAYGSPKWEVSSGEDRYRRSLYTFQKRSAPFAMFNTFDAPSGETCVARREVSNTPLQALTLLNDVAFVEAARHLGTLAARQPGSDTDRIRFVFRQILTRPPTPSEAAHLTTFLNRQRARLQSGELNADELLGSTKGQGPEDTNKMERAVWTLLSRSILNLDEAITKS